MSLVGMEDVMDLYNEDREDCVKLPTKKKAILKLFRENRDLIRIFYMVECSKCKKMTKIDSESTEKVECCKIILKKTETNFVVYMPIEDQITRSVKNNWKYIKEFESSSSNADSYSDARDGEVLKNILKEYKDSDVNILSLCLNIDGANRYKSNTVSLWPIQLSQNFLPPEIRFQTDNIIVAGLYYGKGKLNCRDYLLPLVEELHHLKKNEIQLNIEDDNYTFKPVITSCAVDLPAKSMLNEIKQYGGYYSCPYCKIPGELVPIQAPKKKKEGKKNQAKKKCNKNQAKKKCSKNQAKKKDEIDSNNMVRYVEGGEWEPRDQVEILKQMLVASKTKLIDELDGVKGNIGNLL